VVVWHSGRVLASINGDNLRWAWLVLGWVTVSGRVCVISVCDQAPRSTQPGHPFMCRRNEYQPNDGDTLQLGSEGRYGLCVDGRYKL